MTSLLFKALSAMMTSDATPMATRKPRKPFPTMAVSSPLEIAQHNAAAEAKKQMKQRQQLARKAYRLTTKGGTKS